MRKCSLCFHDIDESQLMPSPQISFTKNGKGKGTIINLCAEDWELLVQSLEPEILDVFLNATRVGLK